MLLQFGSSGGRSTTYIAPWARTFYSSPAINSTAGDSGDAPAYRGPLPWPQPKPTPKPVGRDEQGDTLYVQIEPCNALFGTVKRKRWNPIEVVARSLPVKVKLSLATFSAPVTILGESLNTRGWPIIQEGPPWRMWLEECAIVNGWALEDACGAAPVVTLESFLSSPSPPTDADRLALVKLVECMTEPERIAALETLRKRHE